MRRFPRDPSVLDWARKIHKAQKPKRVAKVIEAMRPPSAYKHPNCSDEAYIVCLNMAAVHYTELLAEMEEAQKETL